MALIKCVDCGKEISDKAKVCPNCGCPIEYSAFEAPVENNDLTTHNDAANTVDEVSALENTTDSASSDSPLIIQAIKENKAIVVGSAIIIAVILVILSIVLSAGNKDIPDLHNGDAGNVSNDYDDSYVSDVYDDNYGSNDFNDYNSHTHDYSVSTTREATCSAQGIKTYSCSCGYSYTESIPTKSHKWVSATCTAPEKCSVCGTTDGEALGHDYFSDGECYRCGGMDPAVSKILSKCSLSLPTLPKIVNECDYDGDVESTVKITDITVEFEYRGDGMVSLVVNFSGTKTYDYRGPGQSDYCMVGWKLYDPAGNVYETGTFYSPEIAMGESFIDKEERLFYDAAPGVYRLEILDVN